jgi:uncharacterized membrane protein
MPQKAEGPLSADSGTRSRSYSEVARDVLVSVVVIASVVASVIVIVVFP